MGTRGARGFTIVETMMFIAITGVMIALLLGGWTVMINTQRYKDSTDTVYTYLQNQYNLVYNVENGRSNALSCRNSTVTSEGPSNSSRGQSSCVLMGRYVHLTEGTNFESYPIVGQDTGGGDEADDEANIKAYEPTVATEKIGLTESSLFVPWGATIRSQQPQGSVAQNVAIILLRTPTSTGAVHTYIVNTAGGDPRINLSDIDSANETRHIFCIDPGTPVSSAAQAVVIREKASSRNSVETLGRDNQC